MTEIEIERGDFSQIDCICCGNTIDSINHLDVALSRLDHKIIVTSEKHTPTQKMWNGGMVDKVSAGYGSNHDGDLLYIGICDVCITEKLLDGTIFYGGDYISSEVSETELDYDNIRRKKIRDNNLNKILKEDK